jgi:hypothetical protein
MKTFRTLVAAACFALPVFSASADWGFFETNRSFAGFTVKGSLENYGVYSSGVQWPAPDWGDILDSDTLTITYYDVKTFKNDGSDVTGGTYWWRVYQTSSTPGAFNSIALNFQTDFGGGDQQWGFSGNTTDLLSGVVFDGSEYTFEFYVEMTGTGPSESKFDNNGGNNFKATFTAVPEPAGILSAGLAMFLFGLRRRRIS